MIAKGILALLVLVVTVFVAWMNLTVGHFDLINCGREFTYTTDEHRNSYLCPIDYDLGKEPKHEWYVMPLLLTTVVDFNR